MSRGWSTSGCSTLIAVFFLSVFAGKVFAQRPPDAGTLLQEQQRTQPRAFERLTPGEVPEKERPHLEETGTKFVVKGFRFTGAEGLATNAELNELLKDSVGKEMGLVGLKRLADRVTKYLQKKGWFLARGYIPKQEIKEGVVEIAVVAGRLEGSAVIKGENLRICESRLQEMIAPAAGGSDAANQKHIERGLLLMNDLPGIKAASTLEPGKGEGTARIVIDASEGPLVDGRVWGDNYGSRYTGQYRGSGLLQVNDPFGYGDQATLTSTDNDLYKYGQAGYSFPIGYSGLRGGFLYSEMRYRIDPDLISLGLDGGSRLAGATLSYPITRGRTANLWVGADYYWKNLWDKSSGTFIDDKYSYAGGIRLYGDRLDTWLGGGYNFFSIGMNAGGLDRSAVESDLIADRSTAETQGAYGKFTFGAYRLQKLYNKFSLFLSANGQVALNNLDSSEKFILGGPNGVRAYPIGEASGDRGGIFTTEIRYDLPEIWVLGAPQLVGFYDVGWIELHESAWENSGTSIGNKNSYAISGGGIGLNLSKPGLYAIQAAWAAKVGTNPGRSLAGMDADGKNDDNRYWVQAMIKF